KNRLAVNEKMNTPLLDFYGKKNLLFNVDGNQDINDVFADIKKILDPLASK
ncbi:MAG: adenylate kinase, partial [Loigolactobacillus coryniformis]|nr:adenylate kinase [Loigolactobacillus coryniformis]